ncbi:MAG: DNA-processing protein DprA, partial [Caulobacteraceae bacterium]
SGLARGIDAAAHAGALATGTVAAIAGGIDQAFPPENRRLYEEIRQRGALVSERRMGLIARAKDFPRRNRLVSGLALGVVVVEAELGSGSLITARFALEQGREVFAVPGSPLDPRARGANDLIRQGACLTESAEDVVRALEGMGQVLAPSPPRYDLGAAAESEADARLSALVGSLLSPTPIPIDEIARAAEAPVAAVLAALVELAIAGRAELLPGGLVASGADSA